jgi:hypothetical protein
MRFVYFFNRIALPALALAALVGGVKHGGYGFSTGR